MRPTQYHLMLRTHVAFFIRALVFGLAATVLIGGCPMDNPGFVDTPSGDSQDTTPSGGTSNGGSSTTGGGDTADGGSTTSQQPTLSSGVHDATLQAAEAKRYRLPMSAGETAIVNAVVPNETSDVDLFVYAPQGTTPVASSTRGAGMPDYVRFTATQAGDYALEVSNISRSGSADFSLDLQRVTSDAAAASPLNGTYEIEEVDGQPLSSGTHEAWVFSDGRFASFFGVFGAADFGLPEDVPYWVDATSGASTDLHYGGSTVTTSVQDSVVTHFGDGTFLIRLSLRITRTEPGVPTVVIDQQYDFGGTLTADGCALCGDVENTANYNDVPVLSFVGTTRLEKCPTSQSCDDTPDLETPPAPSSPQPTNGATNISVDDDLNWADTPRATAYGVWFGTTDPPPSVGVTSSSGWPLATLEHGTTYYWKVVATNDAGATAGPVWSFTTEAEQQYGWGPLGSGTNNSVKALVTYNGQLVAAGAFTTAGGVTCNHIARWNGSTWQPLGSGMNDSVVALTVYNGELIAGGYFTTADGMTRNHIARWNGSTWQPLGSGMDYSVLALTVYNGELIAAGSFETASGVTCNHIARWNGSTWQSLGSAMDRPVKAVTVYNGELIAGGEFETAGDVTCNHIARWNGSIWRPLGSGVAGSVFAQVYALTAFGGELVAGGDFPTAGGVTCNNIARWNGATWRPLASGLMGELHDLNVYNAALIAAGDFMVNNGGFFRLGIARWNGSAWESLGSGMNDSVDALTVHNGELIAGGGFTTADHATCNHIARWGAQP